MTALMLILVGSSFVADGQRVLGGILVGFGVVRAVLGIRDARREP